MSLEPPALPLSEQPSSRERRLALTAVAAGAVATLATLASRLPEQRHVAVYLLWNLTYEWGPQALVLALLLPWRPRAAVVAGAALALNLYFVAFAAWIHSLSRGDALAWLFYFYAFPGALVGALAALFAVRRRPALSTAVTTLAAATATLVGVALSFGVARIAWLCVAG
jgi:hypothetical protein